MERITGRWEGGKGVYLRERYVGKGGEKNDKAFASLLEFPLGQTEIWTELPRRLKNNPWARQRWVDK